MTSLQAVLSDSRELLPYMTVNLSYTEDTTICGHA